MEMKYLIFWGGALFLVPVLTGMALVYRWFRHVIVFVLILGTMWPELFDINFLSEEWYKGSTRGIEINYLDLLVVSLLLAMMMSASRDRFRFFWPTGLGLMILYFVYAGLNVAMSEPKIFGVFEWTKIFRGTLLFTAIAYYVRGPAELRVIMLGLMTAAIWEGLDALYLRYIVGAHRVWGTFAHPNLLSLYGCVMGPIMVVGAMTSQRISTRLLYLFAGALSAVCVVLSISRTGAAVLPILIAVAVLGSLRLRFSTVNVVLVVVMALAGAGMLGKAWSTLMSRYSEASLAEEYLTEGQGRGSYLQVAAHILATHPFGIGLNNWSWWVNEHAAEMNLPNVPYPSIEEIRSGGDLSDRMAGEMQMGPAHNLLALTAGELGWPGLFLFSAMLCQWFYMSLRVWLSRWPRYKWYGLAMFCGLLGVFLQNLTEYEFRLTPIYYLTLLLVGSLPPLMRLAPLEKAAAAQRAAATTLADLPDEDSEAS